MKPALSEKKGPGRGRHLAEPLSSTSMGAKPMNTHNNTIDAGQGARVVVDSSDSLDHLTSDLRHLATLIGIVTNLAIDIIDPDKTQCEQTKKEVTQVSDLLWIARDMAEAVADNSEAAHRRVIVERRAAS